MGTSGEVADQVVRLALDEFEVLLRLSGDGVKNIAVALYAISQNKDNVKGRTSFKNMMKKNKNLEIFSVREEDMKRFAQEAKRYRLAYCALTSKTRGNPDGIIDIMVTSQDAPRVNRIVERFKFAIPTKASIEQMKKIEKEKDNIEKSNDFTDKKKIQEEDIPPKKSKLITDEMMDNHFGMGNIEKEEAPSTNLGRTEQEDNLSENYLKKQQKIVNTTIDDINKKPSVKEKLEKYEKEIKEADNLKLKNKEKINNIVNDNIEKNMKVKER